MALRISPIWWPLLGSTSPAWIPFLAIRNRTFQQNRIRAKKENEERIGRAEKLVLPVLERLELTVLVEEQAEKGFKHDPGVSYLLRTDQGSILFDIGFGEDRQTLVYNTELLGLSMQNLDAVVISHLHPDHMGGLSASRTRKVSAPPELEIPKNIPCFLPDKAESENLTPQVIHSPRLLAAGLATTGPLARSLFFLGWTEEQILLAHLKGKGLIVITGCGHPTIEIILQMVRQLSDEPIHAIIGGLHFPVKKGRGNYAGIHMQTLLGTGKPPWQRINRDDVRHAAEAINQANPKAVFLSAHDTCDFGLERLGWDLNAAVDVVKAGATYRF